MTDVDPNQAGSLLEQPPTQTIPSPPKLDALLVILAARLAYQSRILTQQGPTPATLYRDPSGRPDAIGVSLPNDFALYYNDVPVPGLPINVPLADLNRLSRLQIASDAWARDPSNPLRERVFVTTLDFLEKELRQCRSSTPKP